MIDATRVSFRNAIYSSADQTKIDILLTLEDGTTIPFTADQNDIEPYGRAIFQRIISEQSVSPYVAPVVKKATGATGPAVIS
jgi:hypothetical protein